MEKEKTFAPIFLRCTIMGPDGIARKAWEMRVGDQSFGKAISKESLLQYYEKLGGPTPSGHWRGRLSYSRKKGKRLPTDTKEKEFGSYHEASFDA